MILLSVVVVTYNHESYIQKALQSILDQKVDFDFEVIVTDDCSNDNTFSIVKQFEAAHPTIFKVKRNQVNEGVLKNFQSIISMVEGKYFALLDGDDFWDYDGKLQHQVDFLEKHAEYNGIFHDAKIIMEDQVASKSLFSHKYLYSQSYHYKEVLFPSDLINRLILPSSSALFRNNETIKKDLSLIKDDYSIVWKLTCIISKWSKFYFTNEPWSVYRNHQKGISKSRNMQFHTSHILFLKSLLKDEFFRDYKIDIYRSISNEFQNLLNAAGNNGTSKHIQIKLLYKIFVFQSKYYWILLFKILNKKVL